MGYKTCGNKVWNCANRWNLEIWHGTWFWKNVYSLWVHCCYCTSFIFDLHWCILFNIAIFIILNNVDTLITLFFYVFRWNLKKKKTINIMNKTFLQITQVMQVARAVTTIPMKNDDQYVWISKKGIVFFEIFVVKSNILFNVMDIVSKLKDKGIPIIVPFCMKKSALFIYIYNKICFNLFCCVLHCRCEIHHHWLNLWMIKYYNEEMWN